MPGLGGAIGGWGAGAPASSVSLGGGGVWPGGVGSIMAPHSAFNKNVIVSDMSDMDKRFFGAKGQGNPAESAAELLRVALDAAVEAYDSRPKGRSSSTVSPLLSQSAFVLTDPGS